MKTHLRFFGIENFRVFKDKTEFEFAPITILTGTNSSGKSNLMYALNLVKSEFVPKILDLFNKKFRSSDTNRLGNFDQHINWESKSNKFSICLPATNLHDLIKTQLEFVIEISREPFIEGQIKEIKLIDEFANSIIEIHLDSEHPYSGIPIKVDATYLYRHYVNQFLIAQKLTIDFADINDKEIYSKLLRITKETPQKKLFFFEDDYYFLGRFDRFDYAFKTFKFIESSFSIKTGLLFNYRLIFEKFDFIKELLSLKELLFSNGKNNLDLLITDFISTFGIPYDLFFGTEYPNIQLPLKFSRYRSIPLIEIILRTLDINLISNENFSYEEIILLEKEFTSPLNNTLRSNPEYQHLIKTKYKLIKDAISSSISSEFDQENRKTLITLLSGIIIYAIEFDTKKDNEKFELDNIESTNFLCFANNFFTEKNFTLKLFDSLEIDKLNSEPIVRENDLFSFSQFTKRVKSFIEMPPILKQKMQEFINESAKLFGIGESVEIIIDKNRNKFELIISISKNESKHLADCGTGVFRIISLIFSVINFQFQGTEFFEFAFDNRILHIEEPETNLHPAFQSKLADLFVNAAENFNTQFIIETHSEYLIRKLQYLTAKGDINPEDTVIYYFYPPDDVPPGEDQIKKINILEDGSLTDDFGTGFFDESDKIAMSIWNMNKSQKN